MHTIRTGLLFLPHHYWRTILLASSVALLVAVVFHNPFALLLCTLAAAFVFIDYERRRWLSVSPQFRMGDVLFRISLVLLLTYQLG